ncbi:50S ribosomal protein L32 [Fodinicola acaciae]|uniref:50S ribosomal protein L32 n=1 Tax=Fodinicola acaciae TaxID=2681555 RepID=UPI0013D773A5|nr:50S ribosomal protein L32 [Fodinicola acaciae]
MASSGFRRKSRSRTKSRRAHWKATAPAVTTCAECGNARRPHHACPHCGTYQGRTAV